MYYIIAILFTFVGLYHLIKIESAKRKEIKIISENKEKILGDIKVPMKGIYPITSEELATIKNNLASVVFPQLSKYEIGIIDSSINSGSTISEMKTLSQTLNYSGTTQSIIFSKPGKYTTPIKKKK